MSEPPRAVEPLRPTAMGSVRDLPSPHFEVDSRTLWCPCAQRGLPGTRTGSWEPDASAGPKSLRGGNQFRLPTILNLKFLDGLGVGMLPICNS